MPTYKPRKCEVCDTEFVPEHYSQIICSPECQRKRKRSCDREHHKRRRELISSLKAENAMLKKRITEMESALAERRTTGTKTKNPAQEAEIDTSGFEFCERMRLKMKKLPCGEQYDCWRQPACKKTRGMDREKCLQAIEAKARMTNRGEVILKTEPHYTPRNSLDAI